MKARFQADQDDRFATSVDKVPGGVINGDVDMTDARRHVEGSFAEDRHDAQVFRPEPDEDAPLSQRLGNRWIDNQLWGWLVFDGDQR